MASKKPKELPSNGVWHDVIVKSFDLAGLNWPEEKIIEDFKQTYLKHFNCDNYEFKNAVSTKTGYLISFRRIRTTHFQNLEIITT